jgi:hypothetical protein
MRECRERRRCWVLPSLSGTVPLGLLGLPLLVSGCGSLGGPPPTPVVVVITAVPPSPVVVTATPEPRLAATATAGVAAKPAVVGTPATTGKPTAGVGAGPAQKVPTPAPSPTPTPGTQTLTIGRTNSYRGLLVTVEEARAGARVEGQSASRGKTLVGVRLRLHNPNGVDIHTSGSSIEGLIRLRLPDGGNPAARIQDADMMRPNLQPQTTMTGWAFFELDRPVPLESLVLALGGGQETVVTIPFSGPEPKIATRSFEYLRSTEPVRGLIWSVSGGELRLDIPRQQANPGQELIVVKIRATNPSPTPVFLRGRNAVPQNGPDYLRIRADNGVLLQVSAELSPLPSEFPGKAEQDTLYAWQLPLGSKNPKLVILSPDGSEHELELGPLPPP